MTTVVHGPTPEPAPEPTPAPAPATSRYSGFISYSHADVPLASGLASALQGFAKPWYRLRALHLFLDKGCLTANPALWSAITEALDGSARMILLASPEAAASDWVRRETEYWCDRKGADALLIVLTAGAVEWDDHTGDFDWSRTTALPPSLSKRFRQEPLYVDMTWARDATHLSLKDPRFADAVATIAAPLHQRPKEDLVGEDVRNHRRAVRLARGAVTLLTVLAVLAASTAVLALEQRNTARRQQRLAESRALAAQSTAALESRLDRALLLAVEAVRKVPTVDAKGALFEAVTRSANIERFLGGHEAGVNEVAFSPDGRLVASGDISGEVAVWDTTSATATPRVLGRTGGEVSGLAFTEDASEVVASSFRGQVVRWRVGDGHELGRISLTSAPQTLDATGTVVATLDPDAHEVGILDARDGSRLGAVPLDEDVATQVVRLNRGGTMAAVRAGPIAGDHVIVWDVRAGREARQAIPAAPFSAMAFDGDGTHVVVGGEDGQVCTWPVTGTGRGACKDHLGQPQRIVTGAGGLIVVSLDDKSINVDDGSGTPLPLIGHGAVVKAMAVSADGKRLVAGDGTGAVMIWDLTLQDGFEKYPFRLAADDADYWPSQPVAANADGTVMAAASPDGVEVWARAAAEPGAPWEQRAVLAAEPYSVETVAVSPDGRTVITGGSTTGVLRWDVASPDGPRDRLADPRDALGDLSSGAVTYAAGFSPGGATLVTATAVAADGGRSLHVDVRDGATSQVRKSFDSEPVSGMVDFPMAMSDHALLSASGSHVQVHDLASAQLTADFDVGGGVDSLAITPDGKTAAVAREHRVELWDTARRTRVGTLAVEGDSTMALSFSADGGLLVGGHNDGWASVWDVAQRQRFGGPLLLAGSDVRFVTLTPDQRLIAVSDDVALDVDMRTASWITRACHVAGRNLTDDEVRQYLHRPSGGGGQCLG